MTGSLPFTLAPLDGEPFEVWLHAYAARLDMSADHLAAALELPSRPASGLLTEPLPAQQTAITAATGLSGPAVIAMFAVRGPVPSPPLIRAWMPQQVTRFCPACLAESPAAMPAAWSLPVTFFCLRHDQVLASRCPHCGRKPARLHGAVLPPPARCGGRDGCGGRLDAAAPPSYADISAARTAQQAINQALASVRDPARTAATRRAALDRLTDLTTIASHLTPGDMARTRARFTPDMLAADTIPAAFALLAAPCNSRQPDPLAALATHIPGSTAPAAVPRTWGRASPELRARIAHARDMHLPPIDRLRHATTLPGPAIPAARPHGAPDLAAVRAARLPDQLWPDWALRLTSERSVRHDRFRPFALAGLLLPHSDMQVRHITALVSSQLKPDTAWHQLGKLTAPALRILTELAFAIDTHDIPIDYQRRRDLAASSTLIDESTWATITRTTSTPARGARIEHARRYLYDLITGCSLRTAPPPYQLTGKKAQASYAEFTTGITTGLASALSDHARRLLHGWGIDTEPVSWQPPSDWVTTTRWPGADPARTDSAPIHHALLHDQAPHARIAASLGISSDHLRQVLRHHPLPMPRRPTRRRLYPDDQQPGPHPAQDPDALRIDLDWLRQQYLTWHRTLADIAAEIGCTTAALNTFAHEHGIPVRHRGTNRYLSASAASGRHPSQIPQPLRQVLHGPQATQRLHRLLLIAQHPSIRQAAQAHSIPAASLYAQLARIERDCGGTIINRRPQPRATGNLTPLGERLCQQARDYLGWPPAQPPEVKKRTATTPR
jgi:hypothetical protein